MKLFPLRVVLFTLIGLVAVGSAISVKPFTSSFSFAKVSDGACVNSGVTLVVDFGQDAESLVKCVQDFSGTGWQIFEAASIDAQGTSEYPKSFVCRIAEFPSLSSEDCLGTPSFATGTWVYFHSSVKNKFSGWLRSGQGAASRKPECGDFEGWRFVIGQSTANQVPDIEPKSFKCKK